MAASNLTDRVAEPRRLRLAAHTPHHGMEYHVTDQDRVESFDDYLQFGYRDINRYLRDPTGFKEVDIRRIEERTQHIDDLIEGAPRTKRPLLVYRGMNASPWGFDLDTPPDQMAGARLKLPAFTSTSAHLHIAKNFAERSRSYDVGSMLLEILLPKGTPLLWTPIFRTITRVSAEESEILLARNSTLIIDSSLSSRWYAKNIRVRARVEPPSCHIDDIVIK